MRPFLLSVALVTFIYLVTLQPLVFAQPPPGGCTVPPIFQGGQKLIVTNRTVPPFFTNTATRFNFTTSSSQCRSYCRRRDIRSWSTSQWQLYGQLWNEANRRGYWYDIQRMHALDCNCFVDNICAFHFDKAFHPWHRFYLAQIEQVFQNIDREINPGKWRQRGDFCLGFWDWGYKDPFNNDLTSSTYKYIFSSGATGTLINGTNNIPDGPFRNLRIPPTGTPFNYTQRSPTPGTNGWNTASVSSCLALNDAEANGNGTLGFSPCVENGPHGAIHIAIGATMSNLQWSPGEPDFFLHHSMVDYIWWIWQHRRSSFYPTNPQWQDQMPQPYERWTLNDSKDWNRFCFTYVPQRYVGSGSNYTSSSGLPRSYNSLSQGYKDAVQRIVAQGKPGTIPKDVYAKFLSSHGVFGSAIDPLYNNYLGAVNKAVDNYNNVTAYYRSTQSSSASGTTGTQTLAVARSSSDSGSTTVNTTQTTEFLNAVTGTTN